MRTEKRRLRVWFTCVVEAPKSDRVAGLMRSAREFGRTLWPSGAARVERQYEYVHIHYQLVTSWTDEGGRTADEEGDVHSVSVYQELEEVVSAKLDRLVELVRAALPPGESSFELPGGVISVPASLEAFTAAVSETSGDVRIQCKVRVGPLARDVRDHSLTAAELSDGTQRLVENLMPTFARRAWDALWESQVGRPAGQRREKRKVLISYRTGREKFAEALAHRLGREGFLPWFDRWEILAGDSLPREIMQGFEGVYAVIVVLTADYPSGRWAREELETAITKRVEQQIRVIPVLLEKCETPELLRPLRYVDCRSHEEEAFERQFRDMIDALNGIELNPYR